MGILYIVATPIGNLEDISLRALRILKEVDFVLCEDTRVTRKLLSHYEIHTSTLSYHQHSGAREMTKVFELLSQGKNLALVSDAGTPGISDPGNELVDSLRKQCSLSVRSYSKGTLSHSKEIVIIPIPGPSAVTAIASITGVPMDKFLFLGYPPHKKRRKKFFEEVATSPHPVIFYESPHRIVKSLSELKSTLNTKYQILNTHIVIGRELTKKFETVYRGTIEEVLEKLHKDALKGEFVVVVGKGKNV